MCPSNSYRTYSKTGLSWPFSSFLKVESLRLECKVYLFIMVFFRLLMFSKSELRDVKKLLCYYYSESPVPFFLFFPFFFFPFPPISFVSFVITCTTFLPFPSFSFIIPLSNAASLMSTLQCLYHFYLSTTLYLLLPFSF